MKLYLLIIFTSIGFLSQAQEKREKAINSLKANCVEVSYMISPRIEEDPESSQLINPLDPEATIEICKLVFKLEKKLSKCGAFFDPDNNNDPNTSLFENVEAAYYDASDEAQQLNVMVDDSEFNFQENIQEVNAMATRILTDLNTMILNLREIKKGSQ